MDKQKKAFTINVLRRGSYKWYGRWQAEKRSHLPELKKYYCEECGTICKKKDTQMDHIEPVIPLNKTTEDTPLDEIADRMYCSPEGFQRLCKPCHADKTASEVGIRKEPRSKKRTKKKNNT